VYGKEIVTRKVMKEINSKGRLGLFAFKKKCEVLIENISTISVKILSINHKVCKRAG